MKIVIVGVGKLGEYLAKKLVKEGHAVTLVDVDFTTSQDIINNEDLNYIDGNGLDVSVLKEAGVGESDLLISVMEQDEQNTMCCLLGKKLGAKHTIARIRTPEYSNSIELLKEDLGLSMAINPEKLAAQHIARVLSIPSALDATIFFKGRIQMISLKVKKENLLNGITISNLNKKLEGRIIVCAIERENNTIIPRGNTKIQEEDILHLTGTPKNINEFLKLLDLDDKTQKVIISGGGATSIYLSKYLTEMGMAVKLIEINEERCAFLSEVLPKTLIINGDASDQELLDEEGIDECDAFVALTSIDEENIVYSMFAAMQQVPKIITKVNHINLDGVIEKAKIDTVVTPHKIATNIIVKYVRAMQYGENSSCESIYKFDDDKFEMVEFKVTNTFNKLNTKIKDIELKDGVLITAILRGKNIIFPSGNDVIEENDTIVIIVNESKIQELNDILV